LGGLLKARANKDTQSVFSVVNAPVTIKKPSKALPREAWIMVARWIVF
jgi:hypothetical protein